MKFDFTDQVVLVTGGTRGIGKQIADDFEDLGARVLITGRDAAAVDRFNKDAKANKLSREYFAVDFTDDKNVKCFIDEHVKAAKIDVCVNNAGINRINDIDVTDYDDWKDLMAVNLEAPYLLTREIAKGMKQRSYGRIVNIASIFGVISKAKRSLYSITKFGLRGLTVSSSIELAPYNVLVNTVSPGFVDTELTRRILKENEIAELAEQVPAGRLAKPAEISKVVLFLSSNFNTYISGQNIVVDGGFVNV